MAAALNGISTASMNGTDNQGMPQMDRPTDDASTEQFLMYGYKVVQCSKRYRHDWSVCPFAHTGEMAARRDPSRYLPIFCFHSKQRLPCPRGEDCPYSHNLFEYWLHPQRYRTEMCQFGTSCTRPVCFFAHGESQLRHTGMPGGPQPVVAPPEPNPALAAAGFPGTVTDPAVKQQQQLMALQAAAAGFSGQQMRSDSLLPVVDPRGHAADGYGGIMNGCGSMDMSALSNNFTAPLPASAPLSAPLPQLSPDLIAALSNMSNGPVAPHGLNQLGGGLMHQHSGIPASYSAQLPPTRPLARSMTVGAQPSQLHGNENTPALDDLMKQLAVMQIMQANGGTNASTPLPHVSGGGMDNLLGQLVQMQGQQDQLAGQQVSCTTGMALETLLAVPSSGAMLQHDGSLSCPLPPMYGSHPSLNTLVNQGVPAVSAGLPRAPSAAAAVASNNLILQQQLQLGGLCLSGGSVSPAPSDSGRDAHSPVQNNDGSQATLAALDGLDMRVAAPQKKPQPWSAPVSPCTSVKNGNDLHAAANDAKLTSISFTSSGGRDGDSSTSSPSSISHSVNHLRAVPSKQLHDQVSVDVCDMPSFSDGVAPGSTLGRQVDGGAAPLLVIGDKPLTSAAQLQAAAAVANQKDGQQQHALGQEMAVKLLAQMPEASVRKLLEMVAQQQQ